MPVSGPIDRLRRRILGWTAAFGIAVAVIVPLTYAWFQHDESQAIAQVLAVQIAARIAEASGARGGEWTQAPEALSKLIAPGLPPEMGVRVALVDAGGQVRARHGAPPLPFAASASAPIELGDRRIGAIEVSVGIARGWSFLLWALAGIAMGAAAFALLELLPMRALRRSLTVIGETQRKLEAQVAATDEAYENLQRHHREAEETADALVRAVRQAEIANRTKTEFLANISHELRTPLNAIIGFSEILKDELRGPAHPSYKSYARDIHDSGRLLLAVINDILDLAKVEAGRQELNLDTIAPMELVTSCTNLVGERAIAAGVTLALTGLDGAVEDIHGDPTKLKQILLNLLSNAIKFTPRGGTVTIGIARQTANATDFIVADTGIGMKPEDIPVALEPFRQVDSSLARRYEGTGLGLPLARALAELHGGGLEIHSEPERGTIVTVTIPRGISARVAAE